MATTAAALVAPRCEFEVVLEDFKRKAQLSPKELEEFKFADLAGLQSTIKSIQLKQEAKRRMRYMRRLEPFLQTMTQYGQVVEIFVNTSETLAFVWVSWPCTLESRMQTLRIPGSNEMAANGRCPPEVLEEYLQPAWVLYFHCSC